MTHKPSKNALSIRLTESVVFLRGSSHNGRARRDGNDPPQQAMLRGLLTFEVVKPIRVSSIELGLVGKTKTAWPEGIGSRRVEVSEEHEIFHASTTFFHAASQANTHVARRAASVGPGLTLDLDDLDDSDTEPGFGNRSRSRPRAHAVEREAHDADADGPASRSQSPAGPSREMRTAPPRPPVSSAWPTTLASPIEETSAPSFLSRRLSADTANLQRSGVWNMREHSPVASPGPDHPLASPAAFAVAATPPYTPSSSAPLPPLNRAPSSQSHSSQSSSIEMTDSPHEERGRPTLRTAAPTHLDNFPSPSYSSSGLGHFLHTPQSNPASPDTHQTSSPSSLLSSPRNEDKPQQRLEEFRHALQAGIENMLHHGHRGQGSGQHPSQPLHDGLHAEAQSSPSSASGIDSVRSPSSRVSFDLEDQLPATGVPVTPHQNRQSSLPAPVPESPTSLVYDGQTDDTHSTSRSQSSTPSRTTSRSSSPSAMRTPTAPYAQFAPSATSATPASPSSPSANRHESSERGRERRASSRLSYLLDAVVDRVRSSSGSVERGRERLPPGAGAVGKGKERAPTTEEARGRGAYRTTSPEAHAGAGMANGSRVADRESRTPPGRVRDSGSRTRNLAQEREKEKEMEKEKEREKKEKRRKSTLGKLAEVVGLDTHEHSGDGWKEFRKGTYTYPISFAIPNNAPPSLHCDYGSVTYRLKAYVHRPGAFRSKLAASREVLLIASPGEDEIESHESIVVERQWETQMQYMIAVSARSFPIGGRVPVHMTFLPTAKVKIHRIAVVLDERVEYLTQFKRVARCDPPKRFELMNIKYPARDGPAILPLPTDSVDALMTSPLYPVVQAMANGNEDQMSEIASEFMGPGPWTIHQELMLPASCARMHFTSKHKRSNIAITHTLKIVLRVEKSDDEVATQSKTKKQKLFDIVVQAPVNVLDCRCNPEWTALPQYSLFADDSGSSHHSCPCSVKRRRGPTHNLDPSDSGPSTSGTVRGSVGLTRSNSLWSSGSSSAEVVPGTDTMAVAPHESLVDRTALFGRLIAGLESESGEAPPSYASVVQ